MQQELDRLRASGERLALIRAYEVALAVSRCVWHAHRRGVLHRDTKPANILRDFLSHALQQLGSRFTPALESPVAKVSDVGIARLAGTLEAMPASVITGRHGLHPQKRWVDARWDRPRTSIVSPRLST
jgi:serine/threonine protein kinase